MAQGVRALQAPAGQTSHQARAANRAAHVQLTPSLKGHPDDIVGTQVQRAAVALALVLCARAAAAQTLPRSAAPGRRVPAANGVSHVGRACIRRRRTIVWDTNFGGEIDVIDYRTGRAIFAANYQAILGDEFRPFDPNQGNYIIGVGVTARVGWSCPACSTTSPVTSPIRSTVFPSTGT